ATPGGAGQGPPPVAVDWGGPEELVEAFSWAAEPVRAAVGLLRTDQCWRIIDQVPLPSWADGRVALLGDAAHPMPAYLAQGACQAIEDAHALADVLADALADCQGPHGVAAALAGYQARRAPRATRVSRARQVWESGPFPGRPADDYAASDWLYAPSGPLPIRGCRFAAAGSRRGSEGRGRQRFGPPAMAGWAAGSVAPWTGAVPRQARIAREKNGRGWLRWSPVRAGGGGPCRGAGSRRCPPWRRPAPGGPAQGRPARGGPAARRPAGSLPPRVRLGGLGPYSRREPVPAPLAFSPGPLALAQHHGGPPPRTRAAAPAWATHLSQPPAATSLSVFFPSNARLTGDCARPGRY
ncbi:MAG: 3-hydroxybenzoate 6-monooxygenase, partial [Trebonia sp.]|nr:3-hydroxybenzoate 6-monooxygenase [Trebonia sp.]